MEREASVRAPNPLKGAFLKNKEPVKLIIIFHAVGVIGFLVPALHPVFLKLVPWHLLFMFLILVYAHKPFNPKFLLFILVIFLLGFTAEWAGVKRHLLFGHYTYGKTLGVAIWGVPLIVGVNWFLLTYSAGVLLQRSRLKNAFARMLTGAALLVLLDLLIEPVAIRFDYWHWITGNIPLENYGCWFLISALMLAIFERFRFKKQSVVAPVFLITQFVFFATLYIAGFF